MPVAGSDGKSHHKMVNINFICMCLFQRICISSIKTVKDCKMLKQV